jgi:hypothetical protein
LLCRFPPVKISGNQLKRAWVQFGNLPFPLPRR